MRPARPKTRSPQLLILTSSLLSVGFHSFTLSTRGGAAPCRLVRGSRSIDVERLSDAKIITQKLFSLREALMKSDAIMVQMSLYVELLATVLYVELAREYRGGEIAQL